jgi:hypothetical protein
MILDDAKFNLIDQKIDAIQDKVDSGLLDPGLDGDKARASLQGVRSSLFGLRTTLRECIELDPAWPGPEGPRAA